MELIEDIKRTGLQKNKRIEDAILTGKSEVLKVYDGSVLFVTGFSGFLGKQLIEKLLRTCNIKKIFLLLRPKKGKNATQRLNQILEDPVYDRLRSKKPNFASKLVPVEGDVLELNLGISEDNWQKIAEEVNMIFHSAATINFGEKIKIAALTNVRGTREVLNLAKMCKNLKALVHVSTAFVQSTKSRAKTEIFDDFYKSPFPAESLIELAENVDNDKLEAIVEPLLKDWPNTYTFTKAVTEELVKMKAEELHLPLCIVRPAIVVAAYIEPTPGWIDIKNAYGPSGMLLGLTLGVTHAVLADKDILIDFIPVDIVNNAIIVAACETYHRYTAGDVQTKIYVVTGFRNSWNFGKIVQLLETKARPLSSPKAVWYCFSIVTKYKFIYFLLHWFLHYIPGYIADGILVLIGKKPRLIPVYKKVYAVSSVFEYFTNNYWIFRDYNTLDLYNKMDESDKEIFNFDMGRVNMQDMLFSWFYGVRKFIVKDEDTELEYAAKKQWWFKIANYIFSPVYFYCIFKVFCLFFICIHYFYNLFSTDYTVGTM